MIENLPPSPYNMLQKDSTKTIAIKFARDQIVLSVGIIAASAYNALDKVEIAPNFTTDGLNSLYQGFVTGANLVWATFWGTTVLAVWRFIRTESEYIGNPPDHLL